MKLAKTSFLAIWSIQKGIFLIFEWSSKSCMMARSCKPFSYIKICNSSWSNVPNTRNGPKPIWIIWKGRNAETRRTEIFFKKNQILPGHAVFAVIRPEHCSFIQNFSRKFLGTVLHQNLIKVKKGTFLARFRDCMIQIFPGKTAVYVSCPYDREHSFKKSEKCLERSLGIPVTDCNAVNSWLNV